MIAVSSSGVGFRALARYLVHGRTGLEEGRIAWASARNLPTNDPQLAATIMRATAAQNVRVEKPVYHLVLSFDPTDPVDRAAMERVADRVLTRLGLDRHQALVVAHQDRAHAHLHVLVNRVHPETGKAWDRWQDRRSIQAVLREEERALRLREVPERRSASAVRESALSAPVDERTATARWEFVDRVRAALPAVREAVSWDGVDAALREVGMRLEPRRAGLVVTDGNQYAKASSVSPDMSLKQLEARLGARGNGATVPASHPLEAGPPSPTIVRVVRDVQQLERVHELGVRHRDAIHAVAAERAKLAQLDAAVERRERASVGLTRALASVYSDPARARSAYETAARNDGSDVANTRLQERPESYGALIVQERSRALGLLRERDDSAARERAREAATIGRELAAIDRALAPMVGQDVDRGMSPDAVAVEHTRRRMALEGVASRERAFAGEHRASPGAEALRRGLHEAVRKLTPAEFQQLQALLTKPQIALVVRAREAVRQAILGRERGD